MGGEHPFAKHDVLTDEALDESLVKVRLLHPAKKRGQESLL
jgi:hypothetical protein